MHDDETSNAYLNRAQEYANALATIGEPVKDNDLVMLVVLGKTRTPIAPYGPQAFYGARPSNNNMSNNNNNRGNRNNSRGNNNRGRDNGRQFDWASTQNTVYGTCNRCGIGHIPSQCLNRDPSTIRTRPSANFANTRAQSSNASANWHSDTGANSHVTPDLEAMDNSEAYYGDDALHVGNVHLIYPFPHSENVSDDEEILNVLIEYENAGTLCQERIINSFDGDDLVFEFMIGFRKFTAYREPFLPMNIISPKAYNTIIIEGLEGMRKNLVAIVKDVYVFVGSFTYITDFVVLADIGEFIMSDMAEVLMGRRFRKITKLEYDVGKGLVSFTKIFDTYTYRMPRTIPRLKNFN
ncbi:hypothetical protein Tco_1003853 [Tanacetum coccineum]|uniref:Uncharacterized protein n=1 Tax=Tanacetum coccineum TaxID=301880 RepID=A0ABQ5FAK8_9ASTR